MREIEIGKMIPFSETDGQVSINPIPAENKGVDSLDYDKYIERLDLDRRESEKRLQQNMDKMENRLAENNLRMEAQLREDRQALEQRIANERRLSEERMEKRFSESMTKMDRAIDKIDEGKKWIIGVCITTIVGIAAIALTVIVSIFS